MSRSGAGIVVVQLGMSRKNSLFISDISDVDRSNSSNFAQFVIDLSMASKSRLFKMMPIMVKWEVVSKKKVQQSSIELSIV